MMTFRTALDLLHLEAVCDVTAASSVVSGPKHQQHKHLQDSSCLIWGTASMIKGYRPKALSRASAAPKATMACGTLAISTRLCRDLCLRCGLVCLRYVILHHRCGISVASYPLASSPFQLNGPSSRQLQIPQGHAPCMCSCNQHQFP